MKKPKTESLESLKKRIAKVLLNEYCISADCIDLNTEIDPMLNFAENLNFIVTKYNLRRNNVF